MKRYELLIGSEWRKPKGDSYFESRDPSNGEPIAEFAKANAADVRDACVSSRAAFHRDWGRMDQRCPPRPGSASPRSSLP